MKKKNMTIRLDNEIHNKLVAEAKKETRSITQQVEHIIKLYFKSKPTNMEAKNQDASR